MCLAPSTAKSFDPSAKSICAPISSTKRCRPTFARASIATLKTLLGAIAVFATGGRVALENYAVEKGGVILRLTNQLRKS
jgi:hypothetical protein